MYQKHTYKPNEPTVSKRRHSQKQNMNVLCNGCVRCIGLKSISHTLNAVIYFGCAMLCVFEIGWLDFVELLVVALAIWFRSCDKYEQFLCSFVLCKFATVLVTVCPIQPNDRNVFGQNPLHRIDLECVACSVGSKAQWNGTIKMHRPKLKMKSTRGRQTHQMESVFFFWQKVNCHYEWPTQNHFVLYLDVRFHSIRNFYLRKHFLSSSLFVWKFAEKGRKASICAWVECVDLIKGLKLKVLQEHLCHFVCDIGFMPLRSVTDQTEYFIRLLWQRIIYHKLLRNETFIRLFDCFFLC